MMAMRQLPTKPQGDSAIKPPRGTGPLKGETAPAVKAGKGMRKKPPVDAATERTGGERATRAAATRGAPLDLDDQQPPHRPGKSGERYIRLRVRVEGGDFSIVDSHIVEGPLAQATTFEGGYAYEVTADGRLLHAGSIPDLGVVRSFASPDGTLEQRRHHTYPLSTFEFHARVPADALKRASLPRTAVVLYRVKERPPARAALAQPLSAAMPLAEQRQREMREVGRLVGLPSTVLGAGASTPSARLAGKTRGTKSAAKKT